MPVDKLLQQSNEDSLTALSHIQYQNFRNWIYCYENGNGVLEIKLNPKKKKKIMGLFTRLTNKQKYSNNVSVKKIKGQRNKQAATKCSIK